MLKGEFKNVRRLHPSGLKIHSEWMVGTALMEAQLLVQPVDKDWLPLASVCFLMAWQFRTVALSLVLRS